MLPINRLSQLVRSRSQIVLTRKTFTTTTALWKYKEEGDGCSSLSSDKSSKNRRDGSPGRPKQDCSTKYNLSKSYDKQDVMKKQKGTSCGPLEEDIYLEAKKQGEGSSCGPIESSNKCIKQKPTDEMQKESSKVCSCPAYSTPKGMEDKASRKGQKRSVECSEQNAPKYSTEEDKCSSRIDPCKNKRKAKKDTCNSQKRNDPCISTNTAIENECIPDREKCGKADSSKTKNYCGPKESSYKDSCEESAKQTRKDSCGSRSSESNLCNKNVDSYDACKSNNTECPDICKEKIDPCNMQKEGGKKLDPCRSSKNVCEDDPCEVSQKNYCPEECVEGKPDPCHGDPCKKEIKVPELAPCCKIEAAEECICKLKELQRQWEEVIAAQKKGMKGDSQEPQNVEPAKRKHRGSNMIYTILGSILAAVVYFIYNEDFEPEELFLEDEKVKKDNNDGNDDDD